MKIVLNYKIIFSIVEEIEHKNPNWLVSNALNSLNEILTKGYAI